MVDFPVSGLSHDVYVALSVLFLDPEPLPDVSIVGHRKGGDRIFIIV